MIIYELDDCLQNTPYCDRNGCANSLNNCEGEGCESAFEAYFEDIEETINNYQKGEVVVTEDNYKEIIKLIDLHEEKEPDNIVDFMEKHGLGDEDMKNDITMPGGLA